MGTITKSIMIVVLFVFIGCSPFEPIKVVRGSLNFEVENIKGNVTLIITEEKLIMRDLHIPSNIRLLFLKEASLTLNPGVEVIVGGQILVEESYGIPVTFIKSTRILAAGITEKGNMRAIPGGGK